MYILLSLLLDSEWYVEYIGFYHDVCFLCLCTQSWPDGLLRCIQMWYFSNKKFRHVGTLSRYFLNRSSVFRIIKKNRERDTKNFSRDRLVNPAHLSILFVTHYLLLFIFHRFKTFNKIFFVINKKIFIGKSQTTFTSVRKLNYDENGYFNEFLFHDNIT